MATPQEPRDLELSIMGLGVQYAPNTITPDALSKLAAKNYPDSPAMQKVMGINQFTGITSRPSVGTVDHPLMNLPCPPTISQLHELFMSEGVPLAVEAGRKALAEANLDPSEITHLVSTTCTDSANPGFDYFVAKELGISASVEKVLLHGVGCSGGLATLRTAANLALGHAFRGKPARILCVALEVSTTLVRSELEAIHNNQETRIGVCLFSDCASAAVLSNGVGDSNDSRQGRNKPVYSLLGWQNETLPDSQHELGFEVATSGWKVILTPNVPRLASAALSSSFAQLIENTPQFAKTTTKSTGSRTKGRPGQRQQHQQQQYSKKPADFDWAMHPGGATILTGSASTMGLEPEHMRASYDVYMRYGNSSSATIFSVMDRLRSKEMDEMTPGKRPPSEYVVGCAFGPGMTVEMCMLRRHDVAISGGGDDDGDVIDGVGVPDDIHTPPDTQSEASGSDVGDWSPPTVGSGVGVDEKSVAGSRRMPSDDVGRKEAPMQHPSMSSAPAEADLEDFVQQALSAVELD